MTVKLSPPPRQQYLDANGNPYSGAKLFTYGAGTTTKANTYTTSTGGTANANPIVLDSAGRTPFGLWLTGGSRYKFVLAPSTDTDPPTSPIFTEDNVSGVNDSTDSYIATQRVTTAAAEALAVPANADLASANTVLTGGAITLTAINTATTRIITYGFKFYSNSTNVGYFEVQLKKDGVATGDINKAQPPPVNLPTAGRIASYIFSTTLDLTANEAPALTIRVKLINDTGVAYRWDVVDKIFQVEEVFIQSSL